MTTRTVETERTVHEQEPINLCEVCGKCGETDNPLHEITELPGHESLHFHTTCVPTLDGDGIVPVDSRTTDELGIVRSTKDDPDLRVISAEASQLLGGVFFWGGVVALLVELTVTGLIATVAPTAVLCIGFLLWLMVDHEGEQQARQSLTELFKDNS